MIKEVAFTIYVVTDMKKARAFYEGVLGLKLNPEYDGSGNPNWIEYLVGSSCLAIGRSPDWKPSEDGAVVALEVDNLEAFVAELKKKKVPLKLEPQSFPSCQMAVIEDPDKNKLMIHERKKK